MTTDQRNKIHPHKFAMWLAMGSFAMMFAGLTSAYVVKQAGGNWRTFDLPLVFWISTVVMILSSVAIFFGVRAFKRREIPLYKKLITSTLILGVAFGVLRYRESLERWKRLTRSSPEKQKRTESQCIGIKARPNHAP